MAKGKPEENNPKRRPSRPRASVPRDSPLLAEQKEQRRLAGNPEFMSSKEQEEMADEALRERPRQTRYMHDKDDY
jgi:hypothetical protein